MSKPKPDNRPRELAYTINEAARACKVDPRTIRDWIAQPSVRFPHAQPGGKGGKVMIYIPALEEWLRWQTEKQNAPINRSAA